MSLQPGPPKITIDGCSHADRRAGMFVTVSVPLASGPAMSVHVLAYQSGSPALTSK